MHSENRGKEIEAAQAFNNNKRTYTSLEPLPLCIHQTYERYGYMENLLSCICYPVERLLGVCIQYLCVVHITLRSISERSCLWGDGRLEQSKTNNVQEKFRSWCKISIYVQARTRKISVQIA